ncbi:hypothetical protein [Dokdonia sp.]|uniref:hypothetical protein n=1 Tax=Dokdonia sp. TaxID=2024995 RepID=UPI0032650BBC
MKNRVLSLVFGAALFLGSFTLMSLQQHVEVDAEEAVPVEWSCYAFTHCPDGTKLECTGKQSCTSTPNSVTCDGVAQVCKADAVPVDPC